MRIILATAVMALFLTSCNKVGQKFDKPGFGSPDAATTGDGPRGAGTSTTSTGTSPGSAAGDPAERPQPTDAQKAAIEGGQEVKWDQQGMTWTLPKGWIKDKTETLNFMTRSSGGGDFGFLIGTVSLLGESFPTDISMKAYYDQSIDRKKNGELEQVRWLELDGVRGLEIREAPPEGKEDPRRIQWITYRKYAGQTQMIILTLSSKARSFEKYQDTLYGILYSTKLVH